MHDFLLAKEIMEALKKIALNKRIIEAKSVNIEIGTISMSHDGHPEHLEDINLENLEFGLRSLAKGTSYENTKFIFNQTEGNNWKITNIEV
jgi:Zn finger protein HypA/HybF involved in hydrogenase expression